MVFSFSSSSPNFVHLSVLSKELITGLKLQPSGHYLDATLGGGGHTRLILEAFCDTRVTGIDRDEMAIASTTQMLAEYYPERLTVWQGNFADYTPDQIQFDGIIADLGVSSPQFDQSDRGFSFRHPSPLDMRMDRSQSLTAADIINYWKETDLANLFYEYGEERLSRRIARQIVQQRPFTTTTDLADAIARCVPRSYRYGRIHPATRVFQSLRIAVNEELKSLEQFLNRFPTWLKPDGIIGIISFHSLEDRIVKHYFRQSEQLEVLTKKPIIPQDSEIEHNPRSRSAKLRFARKIST
ncbi:16S rRNA (cytosine(1402)-N(4))-methyltransferase [Aphanothece hegewaldii CCALA 016]|uniref:Ribosomal RNA small subunit methyltransferase H n=1 Tax=Aphanothece hegewaldii CCALA 016 TaxID=2107694 RepID=A0A2T1LUW4_9CHRO|nr:16S rRNA (cytosine(1402)-N(4))-methyltransferase RsmH [Aphanothece hegewaldii]PSF35411.1 16S rRNA (cytosine(1402)-N(4))-methyltransferase [Aphanothece hegewaldii CCALA 016]